MVWFFSLFGMFVIGSVAFWLLLVATSIAIIWSLNDLDDAYVRNYDPINPNRIGGGGFATFAICFFGVLVIFSNWGNLPTDLHWVYVLLAAVACLIAGMATSHWKWHTYRQDITEKFTEEKAQFYLNHNLPPGAAIPMSMKSNWDRNLGRFTIKPEEYRFVKLKTVWAMYWPWVLLWSLLHDFVTRLYQTLVMAMHRSYARITEYHWKHIEAQIPTFTTDEPETMAESGQRGRYR